MSKRILGNDPFKKGSVQRVKREGGRSRKSLDPKAVTPLPTAEVPLVSAVQSTPTAHPASPTGISMASAEPWSHPNSPSLVSQVMGVTPHPESPNLVENRPVYRTWLQQVVGLLTEGPRDSIDNWGRNENLASTLRPLADLLCKRYFRVKLENTEALSTGPLIIVANHTRALPFDGPILHHALSLDCPQLRSLRWLLEDDVFDTPWLGHVLHRLGGVKSTPETVLSLLKNQQPVLVFPEGVHGVNKSSASGYRIERFGRGGYLKLAMKAHATVVPAAIIGADDSLPFVGKLPVIPGVLKYWPMTPLGPLPLPSQWLIRFGSPIALPDKYDESTFADLNETVRHKIQQMLDEVRLAR